MTISMISAGSVNPQAAIPNGGGAEGNLFAQLFAPMLANTQNAIDPPDNQEEGDAGAGFADIFQTFQGNEAPLFSVVEKLPVPEMQTGEGDTDQAVLLFAQTPFVFADSPFPETGEKGEVMPGLQNGAAKTPLNGADFLAHQNALDEDADTALHRNSFATALKEKPGIHVKGGHEKAKFAVSPEKPTVTAPDVSGGKVAFSLPKEQPKDNALALAGATETLAKGLQANQARELAPSGIRMPLNSPGWSEKFGEKIVWMAQNNQQHAKLELNPAHLGPVQITLHLDADKASAVFTAAVPETRQALEEALPRLREMLAEAGVFLGEAEVGSGSHQEAAHENTANKAQNYPRNEADSSILGDNISSSHLRRGDTLVDLFA